METGPGTEFNPGDHVVLAFVPACGHCERCVAGRPALCGPGAQANGAGTLLSGGKRFLAPDGTRPNHHLGVSAFSEYTVVSSRSAVKIDPDLPLDIAALFGCAVLTGAPPLQRSRDPGDTVAVFGLGGVGLSAVLAAKAALRDGLRDRPRPGQTGPRGETGRAPHRRRPGRHRGSPRPHLRRRGKGHRHNGRGPVLEQAYAATRAVAQRSPSASRPQAPRLPALSLVAEEKTLRGSYLGSCVPRRDVPASSPCTATARSR